MDRLTGEIYTVDQIKDLYENAKEQNKLLEFNKRYKIMKVKPTMRQLKRNPNRVSRNEPCPCGSGKKFKRCCMIKSV